MPKPSPSHLERPKNGLGACPRENFLSKNKKSKRSSEGYTCTIRSQSKMKNAMEIE